MYICNECGEVFDDYEVLKQQHPYGDTYAVEEIAVCPHCGDTGFETAKECSMCGEYVAELFDGLCEVCHSDMTE